MNFTDLLKDPKILLHIFEIISNMTGQKEIKEALKKAQDSLKKGDVKGAEKVLGGFDVDSFVDEIYYQNALTKFTDDEQSVIDTLMIKLRKIEPKIHRNLIACIASNTEEGRKNMLKKILSCDEAEDLLILAIARGWDRPDAPKTYEKIIKLITEQTEVADATKKMVIKAIEDAIKTTDEFITTYEENVNKPLEDFLNKLKNHKKK